MFATKISHLLQSLSLTQVELARELAVEQSTISAYLHERRMPDPYTRLILAGISSPGEDRLYWLGLGIPPRHLELIRRAVCETPPPVASPGEAHKLLDEILELGNDQERQLALGNLALLAEAVRIKARGDRAKRRQRAGLTRRA